MLSLRASAAALAALCCLALSPAPLAQEAPRTLDAARLGPGASLRIDGRLDEAEWQAAEASGGFVQSEPEPGAAASHETEVRVLYDRSALYVGITAFVNDPETLVGRLTRRDNLAASDAVFIEVGSPADGRRAFSFGVNLSNVKRDAVLSDDSQVGDGSWDAVWDSAVERFDDARGRGYAVEVRIPFSQLRYDADSERPWQFNVQRDVGATGEVSYWTPVLPDREGYVSQFGLLRGLRDLRAPRRVEVVPYAAGRVTRAPGNAEDPFYDATDAEPLIGLDAKVGLTSGLTLTATVNPDFGQVEADPAVVNLSQFEVSFEERRPFFVEGTDIFSFGATRTFRATDRPTFFYSRRIGAEPFSLRAVRPEVPTLYVDSPDQTTIATAAKVSGQIGAWSIGVLDAVTTEERARYIGLDGEEGRLAVEPLANYFVGRAERTWAGGRALAGGFVSSVIRDVSGEGFAPLVAGDATVGGIDGEIALGDRTWALSGVLAGSLVRGDAAYVERLQRSSRRYYNRPDADHLSLDPTRTALGGYRGEASLTRLRGKVRGSLTLSTTSPGFEANDLGFQTRADVLTSDLEVNYIETQPSPSWLRFWNPFVFSSAQFTYGGENVRTNVNGGYFMQFSNLWNHLVVLSLRPEYSNDRLTRGGPLARRPADYSLTVSANTDSRQRLSGGLQVSRREEFAADHVGVDREWVWQVVPSLRYRVTDALTVEASPEYTAALNTDQYLGRVGTDPALSLDGTRYLFSNVRLETLGLGVRTDWAFSPDLTFQLFLEPSIFAYRFDDFREFAEARTYDFVRYGDARGSVTPVTDEAGAVVRYDIDPGDGGEGFALGNNDFTYLSLRGNAVLRWEWRPGSALFLVWQQTRDEFDDFGGFDVFGDVGDVFGAEVQNVFLVKATYWFGV